MPLILPANTLSTGGYEVANSCRFNDGDSAYVHRTMSASNMDLWTFSAWVKRGSTSTAVALIGSSPTGNNNFETIGITSGGDIDWEHYEYTSSSYKGRLKTNRLLRDPSAWYHIVCVWDSANATAGNRMRLYVNGVEETSFQTDTNPSSGQDSLINSGNPLQVGASGGASQFFDGYMAEVVLLDGTAGSPTDFGEFDEDSPSIWKPKDVSGLTFGTNGFYLDFEASDNLGNDANGGTDFTEVNLAAADQATDTCTNNFCTANPLDQYGSYTLSEGNCKISSGHTSWYTIGSTMAVQNGKWYWETEFDSGTMIEIFVGVHDTSVNRTDTNSWLTGSSLFYNDAGGEIRTDGTNSTEDYGTLTAGDILGIALNMDDKQITLYKNGSAIASNVALSSSISEAMPTFLTDANDVIFKVNFGGCSAFDVSSGNADDNGYGNFEYDVPTGYYALCTKNLAEFG